MFRIARRRPRPRAVTVPLLSAALATTVLAGCGSGDDNTVTMWTYPVIFDEAKNKAYWDGLIKAF
ncbi:sugar ABC transporter substrate-binding protein, partial [Streptomyces sp. NPDC052042]